MATHVEIMRAWRARMNARQRILGHEVVSARKDVIDFRREYLPDGLLDPDDRTVRAWIKEEKKRAGAIGAGNAPGAL